MRFLQDDTHIEGYLGNIHAQRKVRQPGGILHLRLGWRRGHIRLLCLLGNGDGAIVAPGPPESGVDWSGCCCGGFAAGVLGEAWPCGRTGPGCSNQQQRQGCNGKLFGNRNFI